MVNDDETAQWYRYGVVTIPAIIIIILDGQYNYF